MDPLFFWLLGLVGAATLTDHASKQAARRGARKTLEQTQALFSGTHQFVSVDPAQFGWLDRRFYDDTRARLEAQGFRFLGDVEDLTMTEQQPTMRTFIRVMSGDRGEVLLGIYHVKLRGLSAVLQWIGLIPRRLRVLDIESELSDGRFLCTSNTHGVDTTPSPVTIEVLRLPPASSPEITLERHRERMRAALQASPRIEFRKVGSMNEALASQDRMQRQKNTVMGDPEALVQTIEGQRGMRHAKDLLIEEIRRP